MERRLTPRRGFLRGRGTGLEVVGVSVTSKICDKSYSGIRVFQWLRNFMQASD